MKTDDFVQIEKFLSKNGRFCCLNIPPRLKEHFMSVASSIAGKCSFLNGVEFDVILFLLSFFKILVMSTVLKCQNYKRIKFIESVPDCDNAKHNVCHF